MHPTAVFMVSKLVGLYTAGILSPALPTSFCSIIMQFFTLKITTRYTVVCTKSINKDTL